MTEAIDDDPAAILTITRHTTALLNMSASFLMRRRRPPAILVAYPHYIQAHPTGIRFDFFRAYAVITDIGYLDAVLPAGLKPAAHMTKPACANYPIHSHNSAY